MIEIEREKGDTDRGHAPAQRIGLLSDLVQALFPKGLQQLDKEHSYLNANLTT